MSATVIPVTAESARTSAARERMRSLPLRAAGDEPHQGESELLDLGTVKLWRLASDRDRIRGDMAAISKKAPEHLQLMVEAAIGSAGSHAAPFVDADRGDIVAWESTSPSPIDVHPIDARMGWSGFILACPLATLAPRRDGVMGRGVLRFDGTRGSGLVLRRFLLAVWDTLEQDALGGSERSLGEAALDLVRGLCQPPRDPNRPDALLRRQVFDYVDAHLGERELSAASVAEALFVSRSHLYRAFQGERSSVTAWIRHRRLERCRADLLDSALTHESIFAISARWGFVSQAHFSRAFRTAYGCSPREMRQGIR